MPIENVSNIQPTFVGASGVDVYAGKRGAGEKVPDFQGDQLVEIRTFAPLPVEQSGKTKTAGKTSVKATGKSKTKTKRTEFAGGQCHVEGAGFKADVVTPAKVRVPVYGYASTELVVRCVSEGYKPSVETVRAYNKTKSDRLEGASSGGGGFLGVFLVAAINAASDEKKHQFRYPVVEVDLLP